MKLKFIIRNLKFVLLAVALPAFGFDAVMKINPPVISLNETATLSIEVRNARNPQPPAIPDVPGLKINYSGQSTQMNWANGVSDNFVVFNFVIYPQQTGDFPIGPFDFKVGKDSQTLSGQLRVVSGTGNAQQSESWSDYLFARLEADRPAAYVQEPYELTLLIYSRPEIQLAGNLNLTGLPETGFAGFQWQDAGMTRDVINNTVYDVRRFCAQTRAMNSGRYELAPVVTAQIVVPNQQNRQQRGAFGDPFFNSFFNRTETRPVELPVEKTVIEIKPLPPNRPDGFTGGVGQFTFQVDAQPRTIHPGEPVTLTMRISGAGNFDRITASALPADAPFRLYGEPVKKMEQDGIIFEQVISPRDATVTEVPSIPFSFFDTQSGAYLTVSSPPVPLTVQESDHSTAQVFASKETIVLPAADTPFATESDLQQITSFLKNLWQKIRPWLWIIPAAAVLWILIFAARKIYAHRKKDTARARRQKAPAAARKALRAAEHAIKKQNSGAFYDALWNALADYFGNRLNLPPGDITPAVVLRELQQKKFNEQSAGELRTIFEQVELSRYGIAGAKTPAEMKAAQRSLEQILKQCEKEL